MATDSPAHLAQQESPAQLASLVLKAHLERTDLPVPRAPTDHLAQQDPPDPRARRDPMALQERLASPVDKDLLANLDR